ncbi:MAG: tRNA (adenosine(37)-N6)-threonylcarbamoyltransferase complex transferase subunit TsaD, partial [Patescibacteria group bacterium]
DTSCDDTAIAVLQASKSKTTLLSNVVSSQVKLHSKYGGVYPSLAKREHQRNLVVVLQKSLSEARLLKLKMKNEKLKTTNENLKLKSLEKIFEREPELLKKTTSFLQKYQKPKIDTVAVTVGPGLEPCLWAGVNFARALAMWWDLPLMRVNHLEAHLLANWLPKEPSSFGKRNSVPFPAIGLIVSGGHTELVLIKKIGQYQRVGQTRDDAAGECFDKTARILGLGYPGGPAIAALAAKFSISNFQFSNKIQLKLPRPMIGSKDYDFSFSGLKTAVLYDYKKRSKIVRESLSYKIAMAREIQQAVIDVLLKKTMRAVQEYQVKTIILGGGVVSNLDLKQQLKVKSAKLKVDFLAPPKNLCTDNGAMVAMAAWLHFPNRQDWSKMKPNANLSL